MKFFSVAACAFASIAFMGSSAQADTTENQNSKIFKSGPYVGGSLGYSYVNGDLDQSIDGPGITSLDSYWQQTSIDGLNKIFSNSETNAGYEATVFAGYNFELGNFILSPEGSFFFGDKQLASSTGNVIYPFPFHFHTTKFKTKISNDYGVDARLRVGIPIKSFMPYAFAGPSLARMKRSQTFSDSLGLSSLENQSKQSWNWGLIVGGGIEYAASESLSLRLEYKYKRYNLSGNSAHGVYRGLDKSLDNYNVDGNIISSTISIGAAYRF